MDDTHPTTYWLVGYYITTEDRVLRKILIPRIDTNKSGKYLEFLLIPIQFMEILKIINKFATQIKQMFLNIFK